MPAQRRGEEENLSYSGMDFAMDATYFEDAARDDKKKISLTIFIVYNLYLAYTLYNNKNLLIPLFGYSIFNLFIINS